MRLFPRIYGRQFVCFVHSNGLSNLNFGISIELTQPNIEIHLPFCFIRIGWQGTYGNDSPHWVRGKTYDHEK